MSVALDLLRDSSSFLCCMCSLRSHRSSISTSVDELGMAADRIDDFTLDVLQIFDRIDIQTYFHHLSRWKGYITQIA